MNNVAKKFKWVFLVPAIILTIFVTKDLQPTTNITFNKIVDFEQLNCMAVNIFHEARQEPRVGQAAVAWVVLNRVKHGFAPTPCKVVYQVTQLEDRKLCQFSWVCEGKPTPNKNDPFFVKAKQVAYEVMVLEMYKDLLPRNTLFFHAFHIDPLWPYHRVKQIGNHIFYAKKKP